MFLIHHHTDTLNKPSITLQKRRWRPDIIQASTIEIRGDGRNVGSTASVDSFTPWLGQFAESATRK